MNSIRPENAGMLLLLVCSCDSTAGSRHFMDAAVSGLADSAGPVADAAVDVPLRSDASATAPAHCDEGVAIVPDCAKDAGAAELPLETPNRDASDERPDTGPLDAIVPDPALGNRDAAQPIRDGGVLPLDSGARNDGGVVRCPPLNAVGFSPLDGFVPEAESRSMMAAHRVGANRLLPDGAGGSWLLWNRQAAPSSPTEFGILDHFDACGRHTERSTLGADSPQDFIVNANQGLVVWRPFCGTDERSICFTHRNTAGSEVSWEWAPTARSVRTFRLDKDGNVGETFLKNEERRWLSAATSHGTGFYSLTHEGGVWVNRHAGTQVSWSAELFPNVLSPEIEPEAPLDDIHEAVALSHQGITEPVGHGDELVVAATATRGRMIALRETSGVELPLPDDPRCADVLIARVPTDGGEVTYRSVPTAACESLPKLSVVGRRAFVATIVPVPADVRPNDSEHYDIGLTIWDFETEESITTSFGFFEDDWAHAIAPCGNGVCIAGTTGARSVDTGSTVTYGDGLLMRVSPDGELQQKWTLKSSRHAVITHLVTPSNGAPLFFATLNGPVTHTADRDLSLGYNLGILGVLPGLQTVP